MKKVLSILVILTLAVSPFFAKGDKSEKAEETQQEDPDWKESGKSALKATGKFFKDTGKSIKKSVEDASEVKCYGTWVYKTENVETTFICNEDGTMEVSKQIGHDRDYWKGTYTIGIRTFTFKITEAGRKSLFAKSVNSSDVDTTWMITYLVQDENKTIKIFSEYIPTDMDGTDFSKGVIFTKQ